ncbi:MAG TPA: carboxypeptidase regulatory-like domain-containing protein [Blastocatellia bacterium]|nr:carboxypeptidase regulatory-like domain-containing protein [Blastocatellia bacterium]
MKKAINILIAGCLLGALAPSSINNLASGGLAVEAAPALAFVTGTVRDEGGRPLAGATVAVLEPRPRGKEIKSARTDQQGRFTTGVSPGAYLLRAAAEGFIPKLSNRLIIDRPEKINYDFKLKSENTLVQKRGDSDDYRWISLSAPRHVWNLTEGNEEEVVDPSNDMAERKRFLARESSLHGLAQFVAVTSSSPAGAPSADFFGTNFVVSGSLGGNLEMAFIGQRGVGDYAPQRLAAVATVRPAAAHQVTAMLGYGRVGLSRMRYQEFGAFIGADGAAGNVGSLPAQRRNARTVNAPAGLDQTLFDRASLDQISVSATDSWQVFRPLLLIYGFDYSRFVGDINDRDSVLPRLAIQYSPTSRLRVNAAVTPGSGQRLDSLEGFNSENIQASFESAPAEIAGFDAPIHDRSQRFEIGVERALGDGNTSIEASVFYDLISGHGVGLLALPLEASPETQATFRQVAHRIMAMDGAARGFRTALNRRLGSHVTASAGYSFGRGSRLNDEPVSQIAPSQLFRGGFFHVATAKLDLDFTERTGTRVSTVIRLSPSAFVFAIDPFAGRMSVYDPNINVYVTQELPNIGLPGRWEAVVDVRNLLNQALGVEEGGLQLARARMRRTVRGGLAFRW